MSVYVADFETIKNPDGSMRVWLADLCDIDTLYHYTTLTLDEFMGFLFGQREATIYFHNLKFDGTYLISWLYAHGYEYTEEKEGANLTYNFLVTDKSSWFMGRIIGPHNECINVRDSLKKIPQPVAKIAKAYNLPMSKGEIDYTMARDYDYVPTPNEISYVQRDTEIVARALVIHLNQGMAKLTAPADALAEFRALTPNNEEFMVTKYWATHMSEEKFVRKSYIGGISWVNPDIEGEVLGGGNVYDYNSMYPSVMLKYPMPYGYPIKAYGGLPKGFSMGVFNCNVDILRKPGKLACFRNPKTNKWENEAYTGHAIMTTVDIDNVKKNYYGTIEILDGLAWKGVKGVFDSYIDKWAAIKVESGRNGNKAMKTIAKLFLNSLYGKFGTNPERCHKIPYFKDDILHWKLGEKEIGKAFSVPIASFITAYARKELVDGANGCKDFLVYTDTDSLHFITDKDHFPQSRVNDNELGYWKRESTFIKSKYLRQKTYVEVQEDGSLNVVACGLPAECRKYVTFDNFVIGAQYPGKLRPTQRVGGCELVETYFTVRAPLWS